MITVEEMAKMKMHSKEWFNAAFENMEDMPDYIKVAAARICSCYGIKGQADPGYIANVIKYHVTQKDTVCPKTNTGEHCMLDLNDDITCQWCWQAKR